MYSEWKGIFFQGLPSRSLIEDIPPRNLHEGFKWDAKNEEEDGAAAAAALPTSVSDYSFAKLASQSLPPANSVPVCNLHFFHIRSGWKEGEATDSETWEREGQEVGWGASSETC